MLLWLETEALHHLCQGVAEALTITVGEGAIVALDEVGSQVVPDRADGPGLNDDLLKTALGDLGSKAYERMAFQNGLAIVRDIDDDVTKLVNPCRKKMGLCHGHAPL